MKTNEILKIYGTEYKAMTKRLLESARLAADIAPKARIGIKPNLVTPSPADYGATTHPEICEAIIEYLLDNGFSDITILEGAWVGDRTSKAFDICGYGAMAKKYGVRIFDTKTDGSFKVDAHGVSVNVCNIVRDIDFMINVPVLKGHCQTKITCALKNMKGVIPDSEKRHFHTIGLHKPIAHLNTVVKQDFIVIDHICGDLSFEEGGNPVVKNCIMAAKDPVLVDAYVCSLLGYRPNDVLYVKLAEKLGIGCADINKANIVTLEGSSEDADYGRDAVLDVSYAVDEIDSCSSCYAMLVPALIKLSEEGLLDKLNTKIAIGQGHKKNRGEIGVGTCTRRFDFNIPGCPPSTEAIYESLKHYITARLTR